VGVADGACGKPIHPGGDSLVEFGNGRPEDVQGFQQLLEGFVGRAARCRRIQVFVQRHELVRFDDSRLEPGDQLGSCDSEGIMQPTRLTQVQDLGGSADLGHNRECGRLDDRSERRMRAEVVGASREPRAGLGVGRLDAPAPTFTRLEDKRSGVGGIEASGEATGTQSRLTGLQDLRQRGRLP
jgi:hypothetical protein